MAETSSYSANLVLKSVRSFVDTEQFIEDLYPVNCSYRCTHTDNTKTTISSIRNAFSAVLYRVMQIQPKVKNENKSVTSVDSLTSILGYGIQADRDLKKWLKNRLRCNWNSFQNVDGRGGNISYCWTKICCAQEKLNICIYTFLECADIFGCCIDFLHIIWYSNMQKEVLICIDLIIPFWTMDCFLLASSI